MFGKDAGSRMSFGRAARRALRAAAAPTVLLLVAAYFLWNALQGDRGLEESARRQRELSAALADQTRAEQELALWQRRAASLRNRIDTDALDERARAMLDRSDPADIIVTYDKGQRLF
jgi:cell division protein FtsB